MRQVIQLIYRNHYTTKFLIKKCLNCGNGYALRLVRNGYIKQVDLPSTHLSPLFMLTELGLQEAEKIETRHHHYDVNPSSIKQQIVRHNLAIQQAILVVPGVLSYSTEAMFDEKDIFDAKRPDALFEIEGFEGYKIALEVELSEKRGRELEQAIHRHVNSLTQNKYHGVIYVTNNPSIAEKYEARLSYPINTWRKNSNGSWVRVGDSYLIPNEMHLRFAFLYTNKII
jgi:hypothetical protein